MTDKQHRASEDHIQEKLYTGASAQRPVTQNTVRSTGKTATLHRSPPAPNCTWAWRREVERLPRWPTASTRPLQDSDDVARCQTIQHPTFTRMPIYASHLQALVRRGTLRRCIRAGSTTAPSALHTVIQQVAQDMQVTFSYSSRLRLHND